MAFRTIVINNRCKLEYSLNYLICRKENTNTKILIDEIKTIIINSNQVSMTSCLISECINKKIKIIFTDFKHNPIGETVGYYNNYYSYRKIKEQLLISDEMKHKLWRYIIIEKIKNQANNLLYKKLDKSYDMLINYASNVDADISGSLLINALTEGGNVDVFDNDISEATPPTLSDIFPTLYLSNLAAITDGTGTSSSPYQLSV